MKHLWPVLSFALLCILFFCSASSADQLSILKGYWVDKSGASTLAEARESYFEVYDGLIAKGYSSAALWVKLRIPGQAVDEALAVVVRPALLQRIELYDPAVEGGDLAPIVSGRAVDIDEINHVGLDNGFIISSATEDRDLYLRISTTTSLIADVHVIRINDANRTVVISNSIFYVYISFSLFIIM